MAVYAIKCKTSALRRRSIVDILRLTLLPCALKVVADGLAPPRRQTINNNDAGYDFVS